MEKAKSGQKADFPEGIEECGTDALRFALVAYTSQARDINLDIKRVVAYRHWCNKLWNATKFAMKYLPDDFAPASSPDTSAYPFFCRWILSCLSRASETTVQAMERYEFSTATTAVYDFWQYRLCDVFIELCKPVMQQEDSSPGAAAAKRAVQETLWLCLDAGLRLLHPFMPFVTEELWQRLPRRADQAGLQTIMLAPYPAAVPAWTAPELEDRMRSLEEVIGKVRSLRVQYGLTRQRPQLFITCKDAARAAMLRDSSMEIATLASTSEVSVLGSGEEPPHGCGVQIVDDATSVYMMLRGILDPQLEIQKLEKKRGEVSGRIEQINKKMALPGYQDKTPEAVRQQDAEKLSKTEAELSLVDKAIDDFRRIALD